MIEAVKRGLQDKTVNDDNIHIEYFTSVVNSREAEPISTNVNEVTVIIDESTHQLELICCNEKDHLLTFNGYCHFV